jgi:hypothetical protein
MIYVFISLSYSSATISETATSTASPLMEILPFSFIRQRRYPPRFDAWQAKICFFENFAKKLH